MFRFLMCFAVGWVVVDMLGIGPWLDRLTGGGILGSLVSTVAVGAVSWSAVTTAWPIRLLGRITKLRLPSSGNRAGEDGITELAAKAASCDAAFDGSCTAVVARGVAGRAVETIRSSGRDDERFVACGQTAVAVVGGSMLGVDGARGFMVDGAALEAALALADGAFVRLPATPLDRADSKALATTIAEVMSANTASAGASVSAAEGSIEESDYEAAFGPRTPTASAAEVANSA